MLEPFLLDPDLMDDRSHRTSDASTISSDRANFIQRVTDRDGTCVMTGSTTFQACHIVPHAKGRQVCSQYFLNHSEISFLAQYMNNLINHRHEVLEPPLNDINDTRNGILLALQLYNPFGASEVAFLHVSYFAQLSSMWLN